MFEYLGYVMDYRPWLCGFGILVFVFALQYLYDFVVFIANSPPLDDHDRELLRNVAWFFTSIVLIVILIVLAVVFDVHQK